MVRAMKKEIIYSLFSSFLLSFSICFGQQNIQLTGTFSKVNKNCGCYSPGLLSYTDEKGVKTRTYLCFDSEPGDFFEIYNNEKITVSGIEQGIRCSDDILYKNLYVTSSQMEMVSRKLIVPEFIKKQNESLPDMSNVTESKEIKIDLSKIKIGRIKVNLNSQENNSVLTSEEYRLYNLIMEYRKQNGLPSIPISKSLSTVAHLHVQDLVNYYVPSSICNPHSWSNNGNWTSCCYTADHAQAKCIWNKPRELTSYKGDGFEIAFGGAEGYVATPEDALKSWQGSFHHNQVIINAGQWKDYQWKSIGIGIYKGYAVVWFGKEVDNQ